MRIVPARRIMATDHNRIRGEVTEILPDTKFRVQTEDRLILCYLAGKMKINKIRLVIGDKVDIVIGGDIGRIVRRI